MAAALAARARRRDFFLPAWFSESFTLRGPREDSQYFFLQWMLGMTLLCFTIFYVLFCWIRRNAQKEVRNESDQIFQMRTTVSAAMIVVFIWLFSKTISAEINCSTDRRVTCHRTSSTNQRLIKHTALV